MSVCVLVQYCYMAIEIVGKCICNDCHWQQKIEALVKCRVLTAARSEWNIELPPLVYQHVRFDLSRSFGLYLEGSLYLY